MADDMIERVALAIERADSPGLPWHLETEQDQKVYRNLARAAVAAMREPTPEMMLAGFVCCPIHTLSTWEAMIDAAIAEPAGTPDTEASDA